MNPLRRQTNPLNQGAANPPQQPLAGPASIIERMIFNKMYQSNPNFRAFADQMQGKNPEEAFRQQGLDYNQFKNMNPNDIKRMLGL